MRRLSLPSSDDLLTLLLIGLGVLALAGLLAVVVLLWQWAT